MHRLLNVEQAKHFATILFLLIATVAASNAGSIRGVVLDGQSMQPLGDVFVEIERIEKSVVTSGDGKYLFEDIKPGTYAVTFLKNGYEPLSRNDVYVSGERTKRVDVELVPRIAELDKMVVRATSFQRAPDMSTSTKIMNFDEILRTPGALLDVQRAVQNLPSVSSGGDNVNEVIVRGGAPGENLLIMDNIEIPNANHFADQGSGGGVVSLINPLLVKGLTFNAGAPPAQYGGKASSVLDVRLRDGNDVMILGGVDLGMSGVGGHIEGPLWSDATFMASGHKSYFGVIDRLAEIQAVPEFWGIQSKLSQQIGAHNLYANVIYGRNSISIDNAIEETGVDYDIIESGGTVYAGGGSWDAYWNDRYSTVLTLSATGNSFDRLNFNPSPADTGFLNHSLEREQTLKFQNALNLEKNRLLFGAHVRRADFEIDISAEPDTLRRYTPRPGGDTTATVMTDPSGEPIIYLDDTRTDREAYDYGAYISAVLRMFDRIRLIPGCRVDGFTYNRSVTISPRLSTVVPIRPGFDLTAAFGIQYQQPDYAALVAKPTNKNLEPKRATTGVLGIEYFIDALGIKTTIEGFFKQYAHLAVDSSLLTPEPYDESDALVSVGNGRAAGIEVFAQKKLTDMFFYSTAYSFSRSFREDPRPGHDGEWYPSDYDFRHNLTVTGGMKFELLDRQWYESLREKLWFRILSPVMPVADRMEISGKFRYLGGRPYTDPEYDWELRRWRTNTGEDLNGTRYPAYHRLDMRFERRYGFGLLHLIYYFDFQNMYNRRNIWTTIYSDRRHEETPIYQLPFFVVGGIIVGF